MITARNYARERLRDEVRLRYYHLAGIIFARQRAEAALPAKEIESASAFTLSCGAGQLPKSSRASRRRRIVTAIWNRWSLMSRLILHSSHSHVEGHAKQLMVLVSD